MSLINPFVIDQNTGIDKNRQRIQPADRDHSKLFKLTDEQQKKLKEQSYSEKKLREAARGGAGQGQAGSLKRQMLYERLKLLLQQVALMDKQAAKAAMAEVKRIAGELRQMSAQAASAASPAADTEAGIAETPSTVAASTPQTPAIPIPGINSAQVSSSGQATDKVVSTAAPAKTDSAGKAQGGDEMEELKQMLKRILRALKKRMADAPDNQTGASDPRQAPEPAVTGGFIDIKV